MGTSMLVIWLLLLMIHSLFDVRVDMISAKFALWNDLSVIETGLR